jgi:hypothetical protein
MNDVVVVVGLDPTTVILGDIGMDVPHRVTVTIPGEKALISKDLWRAVNQKRVFQLRSNQLPTPKSTSFVEMEALKEKYNQLQEISSRVQAENVKLREALATKEAELQSLRSQNSEVKDYFAQIKSLILQNPGQANPSEQRVVVKPTESFYVPVLEAPAFIPARIKSDELGEQRVEIASETTEASSLTEAQNMLRNMRSK